jgi:hypothetical protein
MVSRTTKTHLAEGIEMSKIYTRRDSITTILRKAGIDKAHYNDYIIKLDDFSFKLSPEFYEKSSAKAEVKAEKKPTSKPAKEHKTKPSRKMPVKVVYEEVTAPAKAYRVDPNNITNTIKTLILDGKSNKEIWDIVQPQFDMDDTKRHYPAWYRSQMKRKGQLS